MLIMPLINNLSVSSLPLELRADESRLSTATGFVVRCGEVLYLVSNWHVFAGKDPVSGENKGPSSPTSVSITTVGFDDLERAHGRTRELPLVTDYDENGERASLWLQHPRGHEVDVAVIALPSDFKLEPDPVPLHKPDHAERPELHFALDVADPVVVVGYPFGKHAGVDWAAIWLHGHIASPPSLPYLGEARFLVDARTREGMSGSPVYFYPRGRRVWFVEGGYDYLRPDAAQLLGVYPGRIDAQSDLGFVWRKELIDEIIRSGVPGVYH